MGLFPFCSFLSLIFATILLLGYANGQQQSSSRFEGPHNSISITNENGETHVISRQYSKSFDNVKNRIAIGVPNLLADKAVAKEFPWMVFIDAGFTKYYQCSPNTSYTYSFIFSSNGVLINNEWVLTSASGLHWQGDAPIWPCQNASLQEIYKNPFANEATIYLGAVNMAYNPKPVVEPQRVVIDSRLILHHPDYNPAEMIASLPADLALIKLPFPIEFNDFISPITLPSADNSTSNNITNKNLTMVSYGYTVRGKEDSWTIRDRGELRKSNISGQPNDECQSTFPKGKLNDSRVACVAGLGFAYYGDDGAAIAHMDGADGNQETRNWTLTAIAAKLNYAGRKNSLTGQDILKAFSVGVKIEPHLEWINSIINNDPITQPPTVSPTPLYSPTPTGGVGGLSILHFSSIALLITSPLMMLRRYVLC